MLLLVSVFSCNILKEGRTDFYSSELIIPELVIVNSGSYYMGRDSSGYMNDESPSHLVYLKDYYIGKYEITNKEFCCFLNSEGNQLDSTGEKWCYMPEDIKSVYNFKYNYIYFSNNKFLVKTGYENYPVIFITWYAAEAYCNWLSIKTKRKFRLPTEAEWEYAARSRGKDILYSWGNNEPRGKTACNFGDILYYKTLNKNKNPHYPKCKFNDGFKGLAPVGSYVPNELGIYDMNGNVSEFCLDWFSESYYSISPIHNPCCLDVNLIKTGFDIGKVIRGGSFGNPIFWCNNYYRVGRGVFPNKTAYFGGFRIVEEL